MSITNGLSPSAGRKIVPGQESFHADARIISLDPSRWTEAYVRCGR